MGCGSKVISSSSFFLRLRVHGPGKGGPYPSAVGPRRSPFSFYKDCRAEKIKGPSRRRRKELLAAHACTTDDVSRRRAHGRATAAAAGSGGRWNLAGWPQPQTAVVTRSRVASRRAAASSWERATRAPFPFAASLSLPPGRRAPSSVGYQERRTARRAGMHAGMACRLRPSYSDGELCTPRRDRFGSIPRLPPAYTCHFFRKAAYTCLALPASPPPLLTCWSSPFLLPAACGSSA